MKIPVSSVVTPLAAACLLCSVSPAFATNGDLRIGLNAIENGMGGAVIAAPESATTLFHNPAGLQSVGVKRMRMDMGLGFLNPPREVNGVKSDSNLFFMPAGAVAFRKSSRVVMGLGFSGIAGFGMDLPDALPAAPGNQAFVTTRELFRASPAFSIRLNKALALGVTIDLYNQSLALSTPAFTLPQNRQFGFGASIGAIWTPNDHWHFGVSYNSEGDIAEHHFNTADGKFKLDMNHPAIFSLGAAYDVNPDLKIEGKIEQVFFSQVRDKVTLTKPAGFTGPVPPSLNFGWSNQTIFAIGLRKNMGKKMTLRAGLNWAKTPIDPEDVNSNLGSAAVTESHISFALSRHISDHMATNVAYTRALENSVDSSTSPNTMKMYQNVLNFNLTFKF